VLTPEPSVSAGRSERGQVSEGTGEGWIAGLEQILTSAVASLTGTGGRCNP
jgi:hypothetical protein